MSDNTKKWWTAIAAAFVADAVFDTGITKSIGENVVDFFKDSGESIGLALDGEDWRASSPGLLERQKPVKTDSWLGQAGGFVKENKDLVRLAAGALGDYGAGQDKKDAAAKLSQSRINELREADKITQEGNARFSASVMGQRGGLMNTRNRLSTNMFSPVKVGG